MRITKSQLQTLALVAEQPHDTPEECVEAIVERYWELLGEMRFYAGVAKVGGIPFLLGPFSTRGQVERLGASPIPFVTPEGWKRGLAKADEPPPLPKAYQEIADDAALFAARRRKR